MKAAVAGGSPQGASLKDSEDTGYALSGSGDTAREGQPVRPGCDDGVKGGKVGGTGTAWARAIAALRATKEAGDRLFFTAQELLVSFICY